MTTRATRFAIGLAVLAACGAPHGRSIGNRSGPAAWVGHYACSIEQGGWRYPLYACDIRASHGTYELVKLEGQMQLRGVIEANGRGGFTWHGEVWCTYTEDCKGEVGTDFDAVDGGGWEGHVPPYPLKTGDAMAPLVLTIIPEAAATAAGGVRYGGYGAGGWTGGAYTGEVPVE